TVGAEAAGAVPASGRGAGLWSDAWRQLRRNPLFVVSAGLIALLTVIALFPGLFTSQSPRACDLANSLQPPSAGHWFGYDLQGCDYYTLVIYGARVSMTIGIVVVAASVVIAVVLGSLAGYYGGLLDTLIARVTDVWFAVPFILGAIVILTVLQNRGLFQVSLVLIALGWPTMLRLMRSSVLSVKEMDYVQAAQALGASDLHVLRRHILPNAIAPVIVYATIYVGIVIATEATLSFLGVGLALPAISWGLMINVSQTYILSAPHTLLFPALFLSVAVFSFILMGDALRDALDPKLR
ncbi:MAG: ABC transporter permease, partial [Actinomycetota bacterium]|nr:ABC transporter permease [Actinomycetota bacterium]